MGGSTASNAYGAIPEGYVKVQPYYPAKNGNPLGGDEGPYASTSAETTSRAAFVPHMVTPYRPAPKPQPTMGSLSGS